MDNLSIQSNLLKAFTANFDPEEDRIRLDCNLHIEEQAQIFFTQRLGRLFVLELVKKVEEMSVASSSHDLQTEEKSSSNEIKEPVSISSKQINTWLIKSIDFENLKDGFSKNNKLHAVHIEGHELLLRSILDVFFKMFYIAEWNTDCFPAWIVVKANTESQSATIH